LPREIYGWLFDLLAEDLKLEEAEDIPAADEARALARFVISAWGGRASDGMNPRILENSSGW
jgi:hypothetical protein